MYRCHWLAYKNILLCFIFMQCWCIWMNVDECTSKIWQKENKICKMVVTDQIVRVYFYTCDVPVFIYMMSYSLIFLQGKVTHLCRRCKNLLTVTITWTTFLRDLQEERSMTRTQIFERNNKKRRKYSNLLFTCLREVWSKKFQVVRRAL